jgi:hypothetical protein
MARNNNKINLPTNTTDIRTMAKYLNYIDSIGVVSKDKEQDVFANVKIKESRKNVKNPAKDTHTKSTLKLFGLIDVFSDDSFSVSPLGKKVLDYFLNENSFSEEDRVALMLKVLCRWEIVDNYGRQIHPGFILVKLLCDADMDYYITNHELSHFVMSSNFLYDSQYNEIKEFILNFRSLELPYDKNWKTSKSDIFLSTFDANWRLLTRTSQKVTLTDKQYKKLLLQWEQDPVEDDTESDDTTEVNTDDQKTFIVNECRLNGLSAYISRLYLSLLEGVKVRDYLSYFNSSLKKTRSVKAVQKIYYGTPGSGKSHKVAAEIGETPYRVTFHPDSDYSSIVGSYKPTGSGDEIGYEFMPQVFTNAYVYAWQHPEENINLVIEEINRGNCAQIFGDIFQLLDREEGYSTYSITPNKDLKDYLVKQFKFDEKFFFGRGYNDEREKKVLKGEIMILPDNLSIYATMNTSDQSLFPMDSAFKRRWDWEYVPVCYTPETQDNAVNTAYNYTINLGNGEEKRWIDFLKGVNKKILKVTESEDKQMGNYFIKSNVDALTFVNKVMYYLWSEICKEEFGTKNNFFRDSDNNEFSFNQLFNLNDNEDLLRSFIDAMINYGQEN